MAMSDLSEGADVAQGEKRETSDLAWLELSSDPSRPPEVSTVWNTGPSRPISD